MSQIEGSTCRCGRAVAPARRYCPDCQRSMTAARFEGEGVVETQTSEAVTAEGFEAPVHIAVVRIKDGSRGKPPVRVLARGEKPFTAGKSVQLEARGEVLWAKPP